MSSTAATVLPVDESPEHETQRDAARTTMINGLLQRGFPLMVFPGELEREFRQAGLAAKRQLLHAALMARVLCGKDARGSETFAGG